MQNEDRILTALLLLGGVPPLISGLLASAAPLWYLGLTGVTEVVGPAARDAMAFLWHLQGGDAAVAGAARVAVALLGGLLLKRLMVAMIVVHSGYEIWLLPSHAFPWCAAHEGVCTPLYVAELWAFLALHLVLVAGGLWALARGYAVNRAAI
ncbi:hypothetical protein PC39_05100 [Salinisphaera sp. PC39]|uniref:hypothetical protein n=1 Tax=Salinisphaera sp. PC39 TaxID=1304156 RepID=UPI003342696F